jgi:phospholipase/lecithinase/hemolysin
MIAHRLRTAAFALCLLVPVASHAGPYDSIVVFGDSLSDGGGDLALSASFHAFDPAFQIGSGTGIGGHHNNTAACLNGRVADVGSTVTAACAAAGPNIYPFRDRVQPTMRAQQIPGAQVALAVGVPEPSEMALIFIGLFALLALVRRRRR